MSKVKKSFRKNMFRGIELSEVLEKPINEIVSMLNARQRRRYKRGVPKKYESLLKKLRKSKEAAAKVENENQKESRLILENVLCFKKSSIWEFILKDIIDYVVAVNLEGLVAPTPNFP